MQSAPLPAPVQASLPHLARQLGIILASLAAIVARRFLHEPRFFSIIIPLCTRITRAARRFERLTVRLAGGPLPKPRARKSGRGGPHPSVLPTGRGWLVRALGWEAAGCGSQLEFLLAEPAAVEFLALVPAARRILSPIGRMLGLAAFAPKPRPRKPRARKRTHKPRARAPRAARPCPLPTQFVHVPSAHWPWLPAPPRVPKPT